MRNDDRVRREAAAGAHHEEQIEVREQVYYEPKFFKVYNHVQERFARRVGFRAWGIYCSLKQFADWNASQAKCTVSLARICIMWGIGMSTAKRGIRRLRDFGLIKVKKNQGSSTYTILKIPVPRQVKNDPSDRSQMTFQTGHKRPIDQTLFTRPSLPKGKSTKTNLSRELHEAETKLKAVSGELRQMMETFSQGHRMHLLDKNEGFRALRDERDRLEARIASLKK